MVILDFPVQEVLFREPEEVQAFLALKRLPDEEIAIAGESDVSVIIRPCDQVSIYPAG